MACYDVYRDQLAGLFHGHALWEPNPAGLYDHVRVGDVGYVSQGHFLRMFNVLLPADDPGQSYGVPEGFEPLSMGPFGNIRHLALFHGDYCSNTVSSREHGIGAQIQVAPQGGGANASFKCKKNKGAVLSLPFNASREDAIRTKAFETYIRRHCDSWLAHAIVNDLGVDKLEDIILVTGCDRTNSWAMAAVMNAMHDVDISLGAQAAGGIGGVNFRWGVSHDTQNSVAFHDSGPAQQPEEAEKMQCVFIRGFRTKRIFQFYKKLKAAAGPQPDDPDNEPESAMELLREPHVPEHRDPLLGVLDYIAEKCADKDIELVIAHEDDLKSIEGVDVLTADAVENFLRQNEMPIQSEKGVALLGDDEEEVVPEEEKVTFLAQAELEGEQIPLTIHPPAEHDYGLPSEEYFSAAVYPPIHVLVLESGQGYPQNIQVHASDKSTGIGVTVEDVLKAIFDDLQKPSSQREWAALSDELRQQVEEAFEARSRTEEERGSGLRRVDYLCGRDRLQIFAKHPAQVPDEEQIHTPLPSPGRPLDASDVAGPSTLPLRAGDKGKGRAV
ncbi:hypothetical protein BC834DRAFT_969641 [Gloeopeniophorella convolvens]|nr:hypothetical protein BC834DRAFT_969641 [Gloeopeniophorella convolvens]